MKQLRNIFLLLLLIIPTYAVIISIGNIDLLKNQISNFKLIYLYFSLTLMFSSQILRFLRWHVWIRKIVNGITMRDDFLIFFSGLALLATPARLGEAVRSFFINRRYSISYSKTIPIVLVERLYELVAIGIITGVAMLFTTFNPFMLIIPISLIVFFLIGRNKDLMTKILMKLSKVKFLAKRLPNMNESIETIFYLTGKKYIVPSMTISIFASLLDFIGIYMLVIGFSIPLSLPEMILIISYSTLIGFFSFLPAGLLAVESTVIGLLQLKGITYSSSVVFLILYRVVSTIFISIIGIMIFQYTVRKKNL